MGEGVEGEGTVKGEGDGGMEERAWHDLLFLFFFFVFKKRENENK